MSYVERVFKGLPEKGAALTKEKGKPPILRGFSVVTQKQFRADETTFREFAVFYLYNQLRLSKTTLLDKRTQFVAYLRPPRVKPRDFIICVPLKHRAVRKTPIAPSVARTMGFSLNSRNFLL